MSDKKGILFKVCGLNFKYFVPFFIIVIISTYMGFLPTVNIYSNDAGSYVATSFIATIAFLMAVGGVFFWLGNTIPIVNNYLGGACLLPLIGASFLNFIGLVPQELVNGTKVLMSGGFQDAYIAMLLVGSILVMDRKILLGATARYLPAILGSQVFALGACMLAGVVTGYGASDALFLIGAPCMSGGSGGAMTTLPALYSSLSGTDMTPMAGQFLCYASIANVLAVVMAAVGSAVTGKMKGLNGNGDILRKSGAAVVTEGEKRPATSPDYVALGSGIFMSFCLYLLGNILGSLPGVSVIPGLAWTIILGIIIKCAGLLPDKIADNCVYSMNFALKSLLPMLIAGIGINSLKFSTLAEFFTPGAFIVIFIGVLGAFIGAMLFGHLAGLWSYEAGVTAGLCCCNIGGSGDLAVLSAANRMNLLAFASISTRIGGALMVIWIGMLYPLFH
ncbi:MAG: 2-hydroxycarboxylate transporter family protein [Lachnospiraceae bacterium]|nr:2-hydroxycarboxylate transporter family protein [Lachnospiraceae bacterium]